MHVVTRFAPSPTGYLHIGGARTALFAWLFAKRHQGTFILRIEDTDVERSTQSSSDAILESFEWLGLKADKGPIYQHDRMDLYRETVAKLEKLGMVYRCDCSKERLESIREAQMQKGLKPRYDGHCRNRKLAKSSETVVRFKTPSEGVVAFQDEVYGAIQVDNQELDDLILIRSDGGPTYNLTATIDDWDMGVTHVIRGDDHLNNTPRQIHILNALKAPIPTYAHLPMILNEAGKRLSKRHDAVSVLSYRDEGYLPEALLNYLVRLGWSFGDQEIFSLDEMIKHFSLDRVSRSPATFSPTKLKWYNQMYMKDANDSRLAELLAKTLARIGLNPQAGADLQAVVALQKSRVSTVTEMANASAFWYRDDIQYDAKALEMHWHENTNAPLEALCQSFKEIPWQLEEIKSTIKATAAEFKLKFPQIAQPLRIALTGNTQSPSIDQTIWLLGQEKTLIRIERALKTLNH